VSARRDDVMSRFYVDSPGGALLAERRHMLKPLLATTVLALLCAPALADDPTMYRIDFSLAADGPTHKDVLFVSDHTCGEMQTKTSQHESKLKICAKPLGGNKTEVGIERRIRDGADEKSAYATVVISGPLSSVHMLDATLTIKPS
jgi:hypothetical protein